MAELAGGFVTSAGLQERPQGQIDNAERKETANED